MTSICILCFTNRCVANRGSASSTSSTAARHNAKSHTNTNDGHVLRSTTHTLTGPIASSERTHAYKTPLHPYMRERLLFLDLTCSTPPGPSPHAVRAHAHTHDIPSRHVASYHGTFGRMPVVGHHHLLRARVQHLDEQLAHLGEELRVALDANAHRALARAYLRVAARHLRGELLPASLLEGARALLLLGQLGTVGKSAYGRGRRI